MAGRRYDLDMIRIAVPLASLLLVTTFWPAGLAAQGARTSASTELSSVKDVTVDISPLGEQALTCGVAVADLESPARAALEASAMKLSQSATNIIFVRANVVAAGEFCAVSVTVELFRWSNDYKVSVSVWGHDALIAGAKEGLNTRVGQKVESMTKEFLAEWMKVRR